MSVIVKGGGGENVTPEVTAQTPVITQIAENLGVTITTPSGTNKQILQGNNANLLNIKNNALSSKLNSIWGTVTPGRYAETVSIPNPFGKADSVKFAAIIASSANSTSMVLKDFISATRMCIVPNSNGMSYAYSNESDIKLPGQITVTDSTIEFQAPNLGSTGQSMNYYHSFANTEHRWVVVGPA